eukprot:CAMPEP_0170410604 /NCGR_PEP_ID=MMETSP0117_2-20130122/29973_1 /TAXON_ID=400756 /ORGANISM="Durinskia baltica, Strain CSIRO CS-38" /LENGTH=80 /DNA_ID=CAMNT_0010668137 /DNA_START=212 /DNA_END=452 /DNA_ORIENTATION=-
MSSLRQQDLGGGSLRLSRASRKGGVHLRLLARGQGFGFAGRMASERGAAGKSAASVNNGPSDTPSRDGVPPESNGLRCTK